MQVELKASRKAFAADWCQLVLSTDNTWYLARADNMLTVYTVEDYLHNVQSEATLLDRSSAPRVV